MADILCLELARSARNKPADDKSAFWKLANRAMRDHFVQKKSLLMSFGVPYAAISEAEADVAHGGDHMMLLFSGTRQLAGHSFAFVIRDIPATQMLKAEIMVVQNATGALLSKCVNVLPISDYSAVWFNDAYAEALELIAPTHQQARTNAAQY